MTFALAIGSRLPACPTSMGRVLLAGLSEAELEAYTSRTEFEQLTERTITDRKAFRAAIDKVRADGYALVDQELEEGVRSIAAPIRNSRGSVIAAMNISCHASRVTVKRMREEFPSPSPRGSPGDHPSRQRSARVLKTRDAITRLTSHVSRLTSHVSRP